MISAPQRRILYVDDDEDCRVMLSALLKLALIDAKTVGTATQALSSIKKERFDLYLLDSRLPDVDGFELCRRMRDFDPHTPILFFSGAAQDADRRRAISAGASAYVIKPEIDTLFETIMKFFSEPENLPARVLSFRPKPTFAAPFSFEPTAA